MLALSFITEIWSPLGWLTKKAGKLNVKEKSWRLCIKTLSWHRWYAMARPSLVPWSDLTKISQLKKKKQKTKHKEPEPKAQRAFKIQPKLTDTVLVSERKPFHDWERRCLRKTGRDDGPSRAGLRMPAHRRAGAPQEKGFRALRPGPLRCRAPDSPRPVLATLPLVCSHSVFPPFTFFLSLFHQARKPADL